MINDSTRFGGRSSPPPSYHPGRKKSVMLSDTQKQVFLNLVPNDLASDPAVERRVENDDDSNVLFWSLPIIISQTYTSLGITGIKIFAPSPLPFLCIQVYTPLFNMFPFMDIAHIQRCMYVLKHMYTWKYSGHDFLVDIISFSGCRLENIFIYNEFFSPFGFVVFSFSLTLTKYLHAHRHRKRDTHTLSLSLLLPLALALALCIFSRLLSRALSRAFSFLLSQSLAISSRFF